MIILIVPVPIISDIPSLSLRKVANKYLKKMLKAEFNYRSKNGVYDKKAKTEYKDIDGDGKYELIVWKDSTHADVFYAVPEEQGALQTYFTFSPESENGKGDRLLFDGGAYFYQRME